LNAKKWLACFAAAVILSLAVVAAGNVLVDPFGVFGDPVLDWYSYNETNNPRVAKIAWLEENYQNYDSYIIGSSSAAAYSVSKLNSYLDANFYNLFVYGCDTADYCDFAAYILENYTVKNLILNIGINEANTYDEGEGSLTEQMHILTDTDSTLWSAMAFYGEYLFANPRYAIDKLSAYRKDTELPQVFDVFQVTTGQYDKRVRDAEPIGDTDLYMGLHASDFVVYGDSATLPYTEECIASVAAIRDLCAQKGVELTVILSPVYIAQWDKYDQNALYAYKNALANEVSYWDFSMSSVSYDARYFYDATHFRNAAGGMALARIFSDESVYCPSDFGTLIEKGEPVYPVETIYPSAEDYSVSVPILMYHHMAETGSEGMFVSPERFEEQIQALAQNGYHAVTMADLIGYVYRGESLPENPVCITMDDGYLSNYVHAWPILEKYDMRGTIFVIGSSVGHKEWYKDTNYPITPHFGWEEAAEMVASGVIEIQSHSYDMHQWAPFETGSEIRECMLPLGEENFLTYRDVLLRDLEKFREEYTEFLPGDVYAVAYPRGEYCIESEVLLHGAGVCVTLTTECAHTNVLIKGLPQSLYGLQRITVSDAMTGDELIAAIRALDGLH